MNAKVKELENKILEEQEKEEHDQSESSSNQKGPYQTPFLGYFPKKVSSDKVPHRGHVVGAGMGDKHSYYFPDSKEKRKEQKIAEQSNLQASIDAAVRKRLNSILPNICLSIGAWFEGADKGFPP